MLQREWLTLPNIVTFLRLILTFIFFVLFLRGISWAWSIFLIAAVSDFIDGWIARSFQQVTQLGKFFDPLVDRLLIVSGIIALYLRGIISIIALSLILGRDVIIVIGYMFLLSRKVKMEVTYIGKIATFCLFSGTLLLLANLEGKVVFWFAIVLYLVSGIQYVYRGAREVFQA